MDSLISMGIGKGIDNSANYSLKLSLNKVVEEVVSLGSEVIMEKTTQKVAEEATKEMASMATQILAAKGIESATNKVTDKLVGNVVNQIRGTVELAQITIEGLSKLAVKASEYSASICAEKASQSGSKLVIESAIQQGTQKVSEKVTEKVTEKGMEKVASIAASTLSKTNAASLLTIPVGFATEKIVEKLGGSETKQKVASFTTELATSATIGAVVGGPIGAGVTSGVYVIGRGVSWGVISLFRLITSSRVQVQSVPNNTATTHQTQVSEQRISYEEEITMIQVTPRFIEELLAEMEHISILTFENYHEYFQVVGLPGTETISISVLLLLLLRYNIHYLGEFTIEMVLFLLRKLNVRGIDIAKDVMNQILGDLLNKIHSIYNQTVYYCKICLLVCKFIKDKISFEQFVIGFGKCTMKFFFEQFVKL